MLCSLGAVGLSGICKFLTKHGLLAEGNRHQEKSEGSLREAGCSGGSPGGIAKPASHSGLPHFPPASASGMQEGRQFQTQVLQSIMWAARACINRGWKLL